MRFFIVVLLSVAIVIPAFATVDPDPDQIGIYFDLNADVTCIEVPPNVPFWAYVVITNPSSPEIFGVEFGLCVETIGAGESMLFSLGEEWWIGVLINPVEFDWCTEGVAVGSAEPLLPQGANAFVVGLNYMMLVEMSLDFYLVPTPAQSIENGLPAYLGTGDTVHSLGVSSGDPDLPVASVNGCNAVTVEASSFGGMKCLYR